MEKVELTLLMWCGYNNFKACSLSSSVPLIRLNHLNLTYLLDNKQAYY